MRYYKIAIKDPTSGKLFQPPGFAGLLGDASYTSFVSGATLPGAWDVELDIPVINAATPQGFALAKVWGISVQEIAQANDLKGKNIEIFGGMQKGLPLANPRQSGLLVSGNVFQAFGNWIGKDMTLDFVIAPGPASGSNPGGVGTLASPRNITLNWRGGQALGQALKSALQTAFPGFTVNVNVSPKLVRPSGDDAPGFYSTLELFAQAMQEMSVSIVKDKDYRGISMVASGKTINVYDNSSATPAASAAVKQIAFTDMIGQPTWIDSPNIQVKTVMRADLAVGSKIQLPPTLIINTAQANSWLINQRDTFAGGFEIISLRHVGTFRQPSADAWVTVIEAAPNKVVSQ